VVCDNDNFLPTYKSKLWILPQDGYHFSSGYTYLYWADQFVCLKSLYILKCEHYLCEQHNLNCSIGVLTMVYDISIHRLLPSSVLKYNIGSVPVCRLRLPEQLSLHNDYILTLMMENVQAVYRSSNIICLQQHTCTQQFWLYPVHNVLCIQC